MSDLKYDIIIIGAGVSGCAVARELSRYDLKIFKRFSQIGLFNKFYVFADFFNCFVFSLIENDFVLFEEITSVCINRYDQRS